MAEAVKFSLSLPTDLYEQVEEKRGDEPRSAYIARVLRACFEDPQKLDRRRAERRAADETERRSTTNGAQGGSGVQSPASRRAPSDGKHAMDLARQRKLNEAREKPKR